MGDEAESKTVRELQADVLAFRDERDWAQFHDPKSLILALVGEVGELAELFQWVPADEAVSVFADPERRRRAGEEMSDVLLYLLGLANTLDVDLGAAVLDKLAEGRRRFPAAEHHGRAPRKH